MGGRRWRCGSAAALQPAVELRLWCGTAELPPNPPNPTPAPPQAYEARAKAQAEAWRAYVAANPAAAAAAAASSSAGGGGGGGGGGSDGGGGFDASTALPVSRVKRLAKLDTATGAIGREAGYLLTVATEMFLEALGAAARGVARVSGGGARREALSMREGARRKELGRGREREAARDTGAARGPLMRAPLRATRALREAR